MQAAASTWVGADAAARDPETEEGALLCARSVQVERSKERERAFVWIAGSRPERRPHPVVRGSGPIGL